MLLIKLFFFVYITFLEKSFALSNDTIIDKQKADKYQDLQQNIHSKFSNGTKIDFDASQKLNINEKVNSNVKKNSFAADSAPVAPAKQAAYGKDGDKAVGGVPDGGKPPGESWAELSECAEEINKYCKNVQKSGDIAVLLCLQENNNKEDTELSSKCHQQLWEQKRKLTEDERFGRAAAQFCGTDLQRLSQCHETVVKEQGKEGHLLSCLLDAKENVTDLRCRQFLTRMEAVVFSDYRLIGPFVQACNSDIVRLQCGRIGETDSNAPHSQGSTIECMLTKLVKTRNIQLEPQCRHQLLRVAELQADDFHIDRPLYFACRADRERFCQEVHAGEGRVLQCLIQNTRQPLMSEECRAQLLLRQQLMARNFKMAHPLVQACRHELQAYHCTPRDDAPQHLFLSFVILCLENAVHTQKNQVNPNCQQQLFQHRQIMMNNYQISPEIAFVCGTEITNFCGGGLDNEGRTIHCLMNGVMNRHNDMTQQCINAVRELIKVADIGQNYKVDPVLAQDCGPAIQQLCTERQATASDVLACLMDNVESKIVSGECENRLLEVQYFLARDFTLDNQLFSACHNDAQRLCSAPNDWANQPQKENQPEPGPVVFTCLYRHAYFDDNEKSKVVDRSQNLSPRCEAEVRRVMRERAISVKLMPQIEEPCLKSLAEFCSDKTGPGEEINCLQEKYDELHPQECKDAIREFTEMESKDVRLNRALSKACRPVIESHCKELANEDIDHQDVLQCLLHVKQKPEMTPKCMAYVRHYEIVTLKDYRFSHKFKEACRSDVDKYCKDQAMQSKQDVIKCLSTTMFENKVLNEGEGLQEQCRRQLKVEYLQIRENDDILDRKLLERCNKDLDKFCKNKKAHPLECLRDVKNQLDETCRKFVFRHEQVQANDNEMDFVLQKACRVVIDKLCADTPKDGILNCLKRAKHHTDMTSRCLAVVERREREQINDIRLQPTLRRLCREDLDKYCKDSMSAVMKKNADEDITNLALTCLRKQFAKGDHYLKPQCRDEVKFYILQSELDPRLDPPFYNACKPEIGRLCTDELINKMGHTSVVECMKSRFYENRLIVSSCIVEMERRTNEELADIQVDPGLHEACAIDIKHYCGDVSPGGGRVIQCLMHASESTNVQLSSKCRGKLEERKQLWKIVFKDKPPVNFNELAQMVQLSPRKHIFLTVAGVLLAIIFIIGLCCGRVTKKLRRELKNK